MILIMRKYPEGKEENVCWRGEAVLCVQVCCMWSEQLSAGCSSRWVGGSMGLVTVVTLLVSPQRPPATRNQGTFQSINIDGRCRAVTWVDCCIDIEENGL